MSFPSKTRNCCKCKTIMQKNPFFNKKVKLFSPGTWPIQQPPEAPILTSATSIGSQIVAEDVSFHNVCWFENENWEALDYVSQ